MRVVSSGNVQHRQCDSLHWLWGRVVHGEHLGSLSDMPSRHVQQCELDVVPELLSRSVQQRRCVIVQQLSVGLVQRCACVFLLWMCGRNVYIIGDHSVCTMPCRDIQWGQCDIMWVVCKRLLQPWGLECVPCVLGRVDCS